MSDKTANRERGDDAFAHLVPLVDQELRRLEQRYHQRERTRNTGQPGALVTGSLANRTAGRSALTGGAVGNRFIDQKHFSTVCARQMRRTLVDRAKGKGSEQPDRSDDDQADTEGIPAIDVSGLLELDQVLMQFEQVDPVATLLFELYYFGGHGYRELAVTTKVSELSVQRQLRFARAWLLAKLHAHP